MKTKWVCVTKYWDSFTYGKIYEVELQGDLLNVPNDFGNYHLPALFRWETIEDYKEHQKRKVYYFISIEEWREQRIEKIIG